ncbi:hypothetical protein GALL_277090 [mine drainage metagenome]|uniref:Oligosaccharide repeat unit polymerase n=1 Tax=mine drainage metagenome TaxID=410659 RepID=A0A1J5RLG2_9ZZZZ
MINILIIAGLLALLIQAMLCYVAWPSRWNLAGHLSIGFCLAAYIIPTLFTAVWDEYPNYIVQKYVEINTIGAIAMLLGTIVGIRISNPQRLGMHIARSFSMQANLGKSLRALEISTLIGLVGLALAYWKMGFAPLLTPDPFMARFFKGAYQTAYERVAYLYRFSFFLLATTLPLLMVALYIRRKLRYLIYAISAFGLIALSLSRGPLGIGVLVFLGMLAASKRGWLKVYILFAAFSFLLGSGLYIVYGTITGSQRFDTVTDIGESLVEQVASGAPDISDQLDFLQRFQKYGEFTYGRTIYGGLVPYHYSWNPGVWTLTMGRSDLDVSEIGSGGLRLTPSLWGYVDFGWIGVFVIPFISGMITGWWGCLMRWGKFELSLYAGTLLMLLYMNLGAQMSSFYTLSFYSVPPAIVVLMLIWMLLPKRQLRFEDLSGTPNRCDRFSNHESYGRK